MIDGSKEMVCICGVGARTPLGLNALSSSAAVRAAISAVALHPIFVDKTGEKMCVAHDALLDPFIPATDRFVTLLHASLQEALAGATTLRGGTPVPFIIGLPEPRPGLPPDLDQMLALRLREEDIVRPTDPILMLPHGHAAGLMAIQVAAQKIMDGETEVCVAAGVDSYINPYTLEWLDETGRLMSGENRNGFPPGEGAAACLLASRTAAERNGLPVLATIAATSTEIEPIAITAEGVCIGQGLSKTIQNVARQLHLPEQKITATYCDLNGERYRNEEFTYTLLRTQESFVDAHDYLHPADCWGDVGAASGPLFASLAIMSSLRGYSKGPTPLLWAGSESGYRSAVLLSLPST